MAAAAPDRDSLLTFQELFQQTAFDANGGDVTAVYNALSPDPANAETAANLLALIANNPNLQGYLFYGNDDKIYVVHSLHRVSQALGANA
jgi:hypothetical protein